MATVTGKLPLSEAIIVAEFYHRCRLKGLKVALELFTLQGRVDAAVFNQSCELVIGLIEFKKGNSLNEQSEQCARYRRLGLPLMMANKDKIGDAVRWAETLDESRGVPLKQIQKEKRETAPRIIKGVPNWHPNSSFWDDDLNLKDDGKW